MTESKSYYEIDFIPNDTAPEEGLWEDIDLEANRHSLVLATFLAIAKASIIVISVVMICVTLAQVIFRYVVAAPLPWSEEMARYCFVWIVFLGGAVGLARGIHLGVDLVVNMLPPPLRRAMDALTSLLIGGFACVVIYASVPVLNMNMFQRSPALGVQMTYIYMAIPISMGLILLICAERVIRDLSSRTFEED